MIIVLYREEVAEVVAALPEGSTARLHFQHILRTMERKELQAVSVEEHG